MINGTGVLHDLAQAAVLQQSVSLPGPGENATTLLQPGTALLVLSAAVSDYPKASEDVLRNPVLVEEWEGEDGVVTVWPNVPDLRLRYIVTDDDDVQRCEPVCSQTGCHWERIQRKIPHSVCRRHLDHGSMMGLMAREPDMSDEEWDQWRAFKVSSWRMHNLYEAFVREAAWQQKTSQLVRFAKGAGMSLDEAICSLLGLDTIRRERPEPKQLERLRSEFGYIYT